MKQAINDLLVAIKYAGFGSQGCLVAPQRRRRARRRIRIKVRLRGRLRLQEFTSAMSPFTIDLETQAKPLRTARREGQFGLSAVEGKDPMPIRRPSWFPKFRAEHVVQTIYVGRQRLSALRSCQCCQKGPTGLRPEHAPKCRFRRSMRRVPEATRGTRRGQVSADSEPDMRISQLSLKQAAPSQESA